MPKRFESVELIPSVAREIILDLFVEQSVWKKNAIESRVDGIHKREGGIPGKQSLSDVVKKALLDLQKEGTIANRFRQWHLSVGEDLPIGIELSVESLPNSEFENAELGEVAVETASDVIVEREIGVGSESVYVYFNPNDKRLAALEGRNTWECKVGKTAAADSLARVFSLRTALSRQPVVGLVIKTDNSSALERALHAALHLVDAALPESPGVEWFMTSPSLIEEWFDQFQHSLVVLSPEGTRCDSPGRSPG